jgi:phosphatidylglycerophosphate synthase
MVYGVFIMISKKWKTNLFSLLHILVPLLRIDIVFLLLRFVTIITWAVLLISGHNVTMELQLIFVAIIFITDALDGMISRRFSNDCQKYRFRILDAVVDKVGIFLFLLVLIFLDLVIVPIALTIITYNVILTMLFVKKTFRRTPRNLSLIQATMTSRFHAFSVGIFCFFVLNNPSAVNYNTIWLIYFVLLGILALISHFRKIQRLEVEAL